MNSKRIAIVGGGPSGLFVFKGIIAACPERCEIEIFEAGVKSGAGMPYSEQGANTEHITNVSGNEIPDLMLSLTRWLETVPREKLDRFKIDGKTFSDYRVIPRLLFGAFLNDQFDLLLAQAKSMGIRAAIHFESKVEDIKDVPQAGKVTIRIAGGESIAFDTVIICTGHEWPTVHEGKVAGYYDSPYPPAKLQQTFNHPVAIRGSSLTAIDAIRTLARSNGVFIQHDNHHVSFLPDEKIPDFKVVMHSRQGLLPAIRFHLDDPRLSKNSLLSSAAIDEHRRQNEGFLSLDFIFEKDFKDPLKDKDPAFYEMIKEMNIEEFVESMMNFRQSMDPFDLFKLEYENAHQSIKKHKSIYWKEMLAILSFAMNYPAKHFSAEDMKRLHKVLMPLISIVIAFVPQSSCEELMALHKVGRLELIAVGDDSSVDVNEAGKIVYSYTDEGGLRQSRSFETFVDCIGQKHLKLENFPFRTLVRDGTVSEAKLRFKSEEAAVRLQQAGDETVVKDSGDHYVMKVPGLAIDDHFHVVETSGNRNPRIYMMAVPYISGFNPDYSGLDFCEEASKVIVSDMFNISDTA